MLQIEYEKLVHTIYGLSHYQTYSFFLPSRTPPLRLVSADTAIQYWHSCGWGWLLRRLSPAWSGTLTRQTMGFPCHGMGEAGLTMPYLRTSPGTLTDPLEGVCPNHGHFCLNLRVSESHKLVHPSRWGSQAQPQHFLVVVTSLIEAKSMLFDTIL